MRKFTLLLTLLVAMVTTAFAQTVVSNLADFNPGKCYTVTTTERGGWAVSNDQFCSTNDAGLGTSSDPTNANQQFAVLTLDNVDYYLYSVGAKKFVKSDKSLIAGRGEAIEFADASAVGAGRVRVNFKGIANTYINLGGSNQMTIDWWSTVDAGNAVQFLEVADFDPTEALAMLNNVATITYQFKYEGNVVATQEVIAIPGEAYPDYTLPAPYGVTGAAKPEGIVSGDETVTIELTITKALPFEAVAEGEPTKWYYAQIHGNHLSYMTNPGAGAEMPWKINGELITTVDEANADSYTWGFVGNLWTGFKMVSKAGGAIKSTGSGNVTIVENIDEATSFIATAPQAENNAQAENGFCLFNATASQYMNAQNVGINHWTANDAGSTIVVTEREMTVEPEPETPFEVVAVTPAEAVAELTTITVEFSEEIEGTFDMMGMTQIYLGTRSNGCSFEVNGKVLTITPFNPINTPGEYKLVIPEGLITRKSNGEAVTMNGEYVFTVKEAEASFEVVAVTPAEAVAELTTITVEFSEEIEGTFDMMGMTQIYLGTRSNGCSFEVNGKVLTITPFNPINTPGEYKLVIPEGLITRKSNGEAVTMNGEYVFTVKEAEAPFEVVAVTPSEAVAELTTVTVEFSEEIEGTFDMMGMTQIYLGTRSNGCSFEVNGKVLTITPFNPINTPGEYKLVIPEGLITRKSNGEAVTMNGEYVFTVKEAEAPFEVVAVTPTEAVAELTTVTVEFSEEIEGTFDMMGMTQIYLGTRSNGCSFEVNGKVLTITPFNPINTPGEYKLVIPEGLITRKSNGEAVTMNGEYVFTVKEAEAQFEVVAVTPTEAVAELTTVTVEFSEEIEGTFDMMGMTQIYLGTRSNGCSFEVNGKVLTITPFNPINTPGEYKLVIPEGLITRKSNGEAVTMNGEYVFTVKEAEASFEVVAVTPTEAVAELTTVTVEFSEEIEGTFDMMGMTQIYLGTRSNGCSFEVNGKVLTITPFNPINTPGEYKLVIPEGLITRKSNGEAVTMNGEYVFTVKEAEAPFEVVAVTPTEAVAELTTITVEFSEEIEGTFDMMGMTQIYLGTRSNGCSFEVNGKVLTITPFNPINTPGEYKLVIPEGLITRKSNGEAVTMNGEYVFTVKEATVEPEVIPAANKSYTVVAEGHTNVSRPQWAINDEGTAFVSTGNTTVSTDAQKQFAFVTYEEAIYIYSISAKKFVMKDASLSDKNPDAVQLTELENGKFFFKFDADHNVNIGGSGQMTIDWWSTIDGGNQFTLTEAGDFDATEALALLNKTPEPEAPLNVVAVTPAEDEVVNSLREITIEFDAEIAVKELSGTERISIQYLGISNVLIGTTATVEGNTLKLVADSEIKDSGKHTLVIPAGVVTRVSDGVAYEGGTFTFTVEKAAVVVEPLKVVAVTPAEPVETLETITIEFSDKVDVPATASGKFTIADADGNTVATLYASDAAVEGKIVTLTLAEAITTAGEYTFSFAEGLVTRQGDGATCAHTCKITVTGATGIEGINGEAGNSVIYDITGRKIEKITEGGIYIVNGKKVLVK